MKTASTMLAAMTIILVLLGACEKKTTSPTKRTQRLRRPPTRPQTPVPLSLTLDQLQRAPDDNLEFLIIDAAQNAISGMYDWEYEIVQAWSPGLRMLYTTFGVEGEVNNGGFHQYFWNTEGKLAQTALDGFQLVEAKRHVDLLERAIVVQREEEALMKKHEDQGTADAFIDSYEDSKLSPLDSEFYDLKEDLSALRVKYIRSHLSEFIVQ